MPMFSLSITDMFTLLIEIKKRGSLEFLRHLFWKSPKIAHIVPQQVPCRLHRRTTVRKYAAVCFDILTSGSLSLSLSRSLINVSVL